MNKLLLIFTTFILIGVIGCVNPTPRVPYQQICDIKSIRVDDDGEYHIIAVTPSGTVKILYDVDVPYDLIVRYNNVKIATITFNMIDVGDGYSIQDNAVKPTVVLPKSYKIETFDD